MTGNSEKKTLPILAGTIGIFIAAAVSMPYLFHKSQSLPDAGTIGGPLVGLTSHQTKEFYHCRKLFQHEFTIDEGLGPLYNARSCYECHGQPGSVGGSSNNPATTSLVYIGSRIPGTTNATLPLNKIIGSLTSLDVQTYDNHGGPTLLTKSITATFPKSFPDGCKLEPTGVPAGCEFIARRQALPIFGAGLVNAIPDEDLIDLEESQVDRNIDMAGRVSERKDALTGEPRIGRFGWKDRDNTILGVVSSMMNSGLGITTSLSPDFPTVGGLNDLPRCMIPLLPSEPNDTGNILAKLSYFVALTAPPPRGPITPAVTAGEQVFEKAQCSFCHVPELHTSSTVNVVDANSPAPDINYVEIPALEDQPVRAYSDFLLHSMGNKLSDGIPQPKVRAGEWRTPPLWGLRFRKYYLHDGRTNDLDAAIKAHGGQATPSKVAYESMSEKERNDLLAFLRSL